eukprot:g10467.t1
MRIGAANRELALEKGQRSTSPGYDLVPRSVWSKRLGGAVLPMGAFFWYEAIDSLYWLGTVRDSTPSSDSYTVRFLDDPGPVNITFSLKRYDTAAKRPVAAEESTALVRELLRPFSLEDFAEKYWERMPLVIRGRPPNHYDGLVGFGLDNVESVIENGVSLSGEGQEPMVLGSDWNIIKRVFMHADGEFWTAGLPPSAAAEAAEKRPSSPPSDKTAAAAAGVERTGGRDKGEGEGGGRVVSLAEARRAFQRGGFSLVINRLQRRWRGVSKVSLALEDVLGHPVNANLYMTPPKSQGFEAHFDWMDGIVVQLTGSKTWVLYDEMVPFPRPDLKYKPASADLGEPIAVLELHPGDMMYIPRGWPHEAAVNGTGARPPGGSGGGSPAGGGARGPSLHVTFGVETTLSGTYESLLHHALEVAAAEHPLLFGLPPSETKTTTRAGGTDGNDRGEKKRSLDGFGDELEAGVGNEPEVPWLQLLHLWVHDVASRDKRLRKAVPLAPLFVPAAPAEAAAAEAATPPSTLITATRDDDNDDADAGAGEGVCAGYEGATPAAETGQHETPPAAVGKDFQLALEACRVSTAGPAVAERGGASTSTLRLLDLSLKEGMLDSVRSMFAVGGGVNGDGGSDGATAAAAAAAAGLEQESTAWLAARPTEEQEWSRAAFEAFDRTLFSSSLEEKVERFLDVVSPERALRRMVLAATRRARDRRVEAERDLARCKQG